MNEGDVIAGEMRVPAWSLCHAPAGLHVRPKWQQTHGSAIWDTGRRYPVSLMRWEHSIYGTTLSYGAFERGRLQWIDECDCDAHIGG